MAVINGTAASETLAGTAAADTITGKAGNDFLAGGAGNDTLTGGDGDDQVFGESGNDLIVWNLGDDTDLFEGGADTDTALVNGGSGGEVFAVTANGARVRFDRLDPDPFSLDIGTTERLVVNASGGNDFFSTTGNLAALIQVTVDGGAGNDTILGGNGADVLLGGTGNDFIDGQQGNDVAILGAGNDTFQWDPGDGNDTVEGGVGTDTLRFNASAGMESIVISANGARGQLFRNVGNITMDLNDVERIALQALGGADTITVNDLTGTDLKLVAIDLTGVVGGTAGDGQIDTVIANASNGNNTINLALVAGAVSVTGLPAQLTIAHTEVSDNLVINGLGGNDKINASTLPANALNLVLDGGAGNDTLNSGLGNDVLLGGDGNDTVTGDDGNDLALLGAGNDLFLWAPGDGNDTIEGQAGTDTLRFTGSNVSENIDISANGGRVLLFRDVANVIMDLDDVERIEVRALGGADNIVVNDLTGTDVTQVAIDLAAVAGGAAADTSIDNVFVNGTLNDDSIKVASVGSKIVTTGLSAQVSIDHADKTDLLTINGLGGADTIDATKLAAGKIALQINGGLGNDLLVGSAGNDTVIGGDGDDLALLGAGNDRFVWNPGDDNDTIEGQAGTDTLEFHGANVAENIDISANGGRVQFFRNIANVTMDLNDVERIEFTAQGGADTIVVNDLTGTDLKLVAIDLAAVGGGGDAQPDSVIVNGTNGNDKISVALTGGAVSVTGLSAQVTIVNAEAANDRLVVNGLGGNDTINASKLPAGILPLTLDGGVGNDTIIGSLGADILLGNDGNDTVTGDDGNDIAFLGAGNDLFLWTLGDGDDTIEGQADIDTLRFTGVNVGDAFNIKANGGRATVVTSDDAVLDVNDVERIEIRTLGGGDAIFVQDLAGTDVTEVAIDLAATAGGKTADAVNDAVVVNNGAGATMAVTSVGSKMVVTNNSTGQVVSVDHWGKTDSLILGGSNGDDVLNASLVAAGKMNLRLSGGLGDDIILGGAGNDTVTGGDGGDTAFLGAGNDVFVWNPGDDNDTIEGQAGTDTLEFNGGNIAENIDISANGGRVLLFRDVANVVMDLNDVERIEFQALGGFDTINVGDLTGTDVKQVAIDLAGVPGGAVGDGQIDTVIANATNGNDKISLAMVGGAISLTGLPAKLTIAHADAIDALTINGFGGDDTINVSTLPASSLRLTVDGGTGNDKITGGLGNNTLVGGDGNDVLTDGNGNDRLVGGNGNDALTGGNGNDLLQGGDGKDILNGGAGTDILDGGGGDDTITGGTGSDVVRYTSILDGQDLVIGFDGNAAGGQDTLDLDALFDSLGVALVDRAARVSVTDTGASVAINVDTDGNGSFDLAAVILKTSDVITIGQDVLVGS